MRVILIVAQAVFLGLGYFILAVTATPFTAAGLAGTPSRMGAAVFIVSRLPLDGPTLLNILKPLLAVPVISLALAFLAGFPGLRRLRWAGAVVCAAGLGYLGYAFPGLLSFKAVPWPLMAFAMLFAGSALFFPFLPEHADAPFARRAALAAQGILWAGTVCFLWYGAVRQNLPVRSLAMVAGCTAGYCLGFYCLARAVWAKGAEPAVWGVIAAILATFAWFHSPPMALPLLGGLVVWLAVVLPS